MTENVKITLKGSQSDSLGNMDSEVFKEVGRFFKKENASYIIATKEGDVSQTSRYKFNHRFLEVVKNGDISSKLYFEAGKEYRTTYRTQYGGIEISTFTKQVTITEENDNIRIFVEYTINSFGERISNNKIDILIENA